VAEHVEGDLGGRELALEVRDARVEPPHVGLVAGLADLLVDLDLLLQAAERAVLSQLPDVVADVPEEVEEAVVPAHPLGCTRLTGRGERTIRYRMRCPTPATSARATRRTLAAFAVMTVVVAQLLAIWHHTQI